MAAKTECPNCGFKQDEGVECIRCGIIFGRIHPSTPAPIPEQPIHSYSRSGRSFKGRLGQCYRIFRWVSLLTVLTIAGLILNDSPPPEVESAPYAVQQAENKVLEFHSTIRQGREGTLTMDESELNGWLDTNLVIQEPEDSASSYSGEPESDSLSTSTEPGEYELDEAVIEKAKSSIRDIQVDLMDDTLCIYAIFDMHGIDLSLELEGHILVEDGYLRLVPVRGKLGSLPLPSGTLQSATTKLFESPENREKFRVPSYIRDMQIDGNQLIVSSREMLNVLR